MYDGTVRFGNYDKSQSFRSYPDSFCLYLSEDEKESQEVPKGPLWEEHKKTDRDLLGEHFWRHEMGKEPVPERELSICIWTLIAR
jgi:hypothetical protein